MSRGKIWSNSALCVARVSKQTPINQHCPFYTRAAGRGNHHRKRHQHTAAENSKTCEQADKSFREAWVWVLHKFSALLSYNWVDNARSTGGCCLYALCVCSVLGNSSAAFILDAICKQACCLCISDNAFLIMSTQSDRLPMGRIFGFPAIYCVAWERSC